MVNKSSGADVTDQSYLINDASNPGKFIFDANSTPVGVYTVSYRTGISGETDGEMEDLAVETFDVTVKEFECTPDPQVDRSVWPTSMSTTRKLVYGNAMKIEITGVTNGDCEYSFSSFSKTEENPPNVSS